MPLLNMKDQHSVSFTLNGRQARMSVETRTLATDALRHTLGLTGTHVGCEHGVCGACTIWIDDVPARACLTLAVQLEGRDVRTVEGLAPRDDELGVLQSAFRRHHALQCGFCTAGILMSAAAFLNECPRPTEQQVREVVGGHLCRCTGYTPIIAAILEAASTLEENNKNV
jgi:2-furoyl-CoA dehydrogenase 2Fe-2S iron sulfur subunit